MNNAIMLDTGPLGRIAHPQPNLEIISWFQGILNTDLEIIIPEIAQIFCSVGEIWGLL